MRPFLMAAVVAVSAVAHAQANFAQPDAQRLETSPCDPELTAESASARLAAWRGAIDDASNSAGEGDRQAIDEQNARHALLARWVEAQTSLDVAQRSYSEDSRARAVASRAQFLAALDAWDAVHRPAQQLKPRCTVSMKSGETSLHRLKELVERVETRHQLVARATSAQVALDDALRGSDDGSSVAEAAAQYRGACEKLATDRVWPMVLAVPFRQHPPTDELRAQLEAPAGCKNAVSAQDVARQAGVRPSSVCGAANQRGPCVPETFWHRRAVLLDSDAARTFLVTHPSRFVFFSGGPHRGEAALPLSIEGLRVRVLRVDGEQLDVEATALSTRPLADVPVLDATTRYARALRFLITAQR